MKYISALCILQDWSWAVVKGCQDSSGERQKGGRRAVERLHKVYLVLALPCAEQLWDNPSPHVWKVSLFSFTTDERIKGLKKRLYSVATLGSLTNSVCISVPAASFILFFWVKWGLGGWGDHFPFSPLYTQLCFPFHNTSGEDSRCPPFLWQSFRGTVDLLGPHQHPWNGNTPFCLAASSTLMKIWRWLNQRLCHISLWSRVSHVALVMLDVCPSAALVISGLFIVGVSWIKADSWSAV